MDDFIQRKQIDKTVPFHSLLKRLKLKTFDSDGVTTKDNSHLPIYYVKLLKLHPLISALILET